MECTNPAIFADLPAELREMIHEFSTPSYYHSTMVEIRNEHPLLYVSNAVRQELLPSYLHGLEQNNQRASEEVLAAARARQLAGDAYHTALMGNACTHVYKVHDAYGTIEC